MLYSLTIRDKKRHDKDKKYDDFPCQSDHLLANKSGPLPNALTPVLSHDPTHKSPLFYQLGTQFGSSSWMLTRCRFL